MPTPPTPFTSAIELLELEVRAVVARCERIGIARDLAEDDRHHSLRGLVGDVQRTADEEQRRRLAAARAAEQAAQEELEARRKATRQAGVVLGLDALCAAHDLTDQDRTMLVLAALPAISREMGSHLDRLATHGWSAATPEVVAAYLELNFARRIELRRRLRADALMLKHGLVTVDLGRTCDPADWPGAEIRLTAKAWATLIGEDPSCGQAAHPASP